MFTSTDNAVCLTFGKSNVSMTMIVLLLCFFLPSHLHGSIADSSLWTYRSQLIGLFLYSSGYRHRHHGRPSLYSVYAVAQARC
jgi:hypothetical protein